ncbi:MAG: carboxypeptidase regulatory-like domain-containing protein [Labilithrix sp.]|nr:carboxypeptidase regulatory-like domain-containing protein [Labilithrix sp.]
MRARWTLSVGLVGMVLAASSVGACGSSGNASEFDAGPDDRDLDGAPPFLVDGGDARACVGLECRKVTCSGGGKTTLSGTVYDPSGSVPLYNALVYVPNAPVDAFVPGVVCDQCGTVPSGRPIATALTNAKGEFVLEDVPVGADVPLVVQIGRWRRQITVPSVAQCADTPLAKDLTRLPRNKDEGDIPKIAITTGSADSLECFVRKLGVEAEIGNPDGAARIHLFRGNGAQIDASTPAATALWNDADALKRYDMVILSCEGDEHNQTKSAAARSNLKSYLDAGGRVFASHFHYTWFKNGPADLAKTASWAPNQNAGDQTVDIDTSFAKGEAFADWLVNVGASTTRAKVAMTELRRNVTTVPGAGAAPDASRRWIHAPNQDTKFYSFNAPVDLAPEQQCGRGVYTDIHVSSGDDSTGTFPGNCKTTGFTAQEKALLFLLFDLASCVQDDDEPPKPPAVK